MIDYDQITSEETPFANRLAQWIKFHLNPSTAIDVGCGPGCYTKALNKYGIKSIGVDIDPRAVGENIRQLPILDLPKENCKYDLVLCLEVFEHIPPDDTEKNMIAIASLLNKGGYLLFSAARPNQGGDGHINCRPREEWLEMIKKNGLIQFQLAEENMIYYIQRGYHMGWFRNNACLFTKPF